MKSFGCMIFFLYIFVHGRASSLVCLKRHNSSGFCDSKAAGNILKSAGFRGEVKKKNLTLQPKLSGFLVKLSRFYVLLVVCKNESDIIEQS